MENESRVRAASVRLKVTCTIHAIIKSNCPHDEMMVLYFLFIAFDRLGGGRGGEEVHCNNVLYLYTIFFKSKRLFS